MKTGIKDDNALRIALAKMPEVIMVEPETLNACSIEDFKEEIRHNDLPNWQPYHHDDKVQELRESLRECVEAMESVKIATQSFVTRAPVTERKRLSYESDEKIEQALTKASNLLK